MNCRIMLPTKAEPRYPPGLLLYSPGELSPGELRVNVRRPFNRKTVSKFL